MSDPSIPDMGDAQRMSQDIASPELVASLLADGDDELAAWVIGQALLDRPRAAVYDDVVRRAMELVGWRWETSDWTISEEHQASVALAAALARVRPADDPGVRIGPVAVLAAPEDEHHVAGLACLAQVLQEDGWQVHNLGANVPPADLGRYVIGRDVDLVALTVATAPRVPSLVRTVDALRDVLVARPAGARPVAILVGGRGAAELAGGLPGADLVTTTLTDAEAFASDLAKRLRR